MDSCLIPSNSLILAKAVGKSLLDLVLHLQYNKDWLNSSYILKLFYYTDSSFSLLGARVGMKGLLKLNCTWSGWNTSAADNKRRQKLSCDVSPQSHHGFWICFEYFFFFSFFSLLYDLWDIGSTQWTLHHPCNSMDFAAVGGMVI